ncbi:MAG: uroporphyrinogen decarboxylase family protein [Candidatus Firestonebacteria bacterium]
MNPRERFEKIINHKEADRVPVDIGGWLCGLRPVALKKLKECLNINGENDHWYKDLDIRVLEKFNIDFRRITAKGRRDFKPKKLPDGTYFDEWGIGRKVIAGDEQMVHFPLQNATIEDIDRYQWPDPYANGRVDGLLEEVEKLYYDTDYVIVAQANVCGVFELSCWLCGFERVLTDFALNPEFIHKLYNKILELQLKYVENYYDVIGKYIHIVQLGDDIGTQNGPFFSPDFYREFVKPYEGKYISAIKQFTKAKIFMHTCGSVYDFIPDLINIGIEILNPIQTRAKNMEPEKLKKEFGDKLVFHGAIDEQEVLPFGTPEDVKKEVKYKIETLGKKGGYILAPSHNIQDDTPPENIVAMLEFALECGKY